MGCLIIGCVECLLGDQVGYTPSDKKNYQILQLLAPSRVGVVRTMTEGWVHTHVWGGTDVALWEVITWFCGDSDAFIRGALIYSMLCRGEAFNASVGWGDGEEIEGCACVF